MKYLLLACLVACTPVTHLVVKRKCPVPVTAVLLDSFLGAALLTVGAIKSNAGKSWEGAAFWMPGIVVLGGAYATEIACMK